MDRTAFDGGRLPDGFRGGDGNNSTELPGVKSGAIALGASALDRGAAVLIGRNRHKIDFQIDLYSNHGWIMESGTW